MHIARLVRNKVVELGQLIAATFAAKALADLEWM